jgi:hypothetical protein
MARMKSFNRWIALWAAAVTLMTLLAVVLGAGKLQAQATTKQKSDSAAHADSMHHKIMPGMKMPAKKSVKKATATPKKNAVSRTLTKGTATKPAPKPAMVDSMPMPMNTHQMTMVEPLGVPMDRMGSGTTWIPDAVVLPSRHYMKGAWELMFHGFVFVQQDEQCGPRGTSQFGSLNWGMFMASRALGGGRFQARTMLSLDPATVTPHGYPLLLQTGETYHDQPLHDRQHPHDFWMELGLLYERPITKRLGVTLYAAPAGEPALGPVAFMHRPSAMDDPVAPLGHHWQDATHISFGVLTAGIFTKRWKLDGSIFNGREPDAERWNFDPIKLDSYSGRFTINPDSTWSFAAGYGYLKSPEILNPDESMHRVTASVLRGQKLGMRGQWASSLIWGANKHSGHSGWTHAALVENEAILDWRNTILSRAEVAQKSAEELVLPTTTFAGDKTFNVGSVSLGYIRELGRRYGATLGIGVRGTVNFVPRDLEPFYGSRTPVGGLIFLRLRPLHRFSMPAMGGMKMPAHE